MTKLISIFEGIIQASVAISAIIAGIHMMVIPAGSKTIMNLPTSMLKDSPFTDFFFPGLILFTVIGLGHAVSFVINIKHYKFYNISNSIMGFGLMIWIFVQVSLVGSGHWFQYLYFGLGTAEVSFAVLLQTLEK